MRFEIYNERGEYIYNLEEAIEEAERQYGERGWEVYNGMEGCNKFSDEEAINAQE